MSEKHPITLGNGCAVSDRLLIVAGFPDSLGADQKYTRLFYLNLDFEDPWQHADWPGHTVTGLCLRKPREGVLRAGCALSDEGYVQIANSSEETVEIIPGSGIRDVEAGKILLAMSVGSMRSAQVFSYVDTADRFIEEQQMGGRASATICAGEATKRPAGPSTDPTAKRLKSSYFEGRLI